MQRTEYSPSFLHAAITFFSVVAIVGFGIFHFKASLQSLLFICIITCSVSAWMLSKNGFTPIREAMNNGIKGAFSAIYIFILIGILIATFIQSGTIALLVYYGLKILEPSYFLPAGLILCSLMSLATGTSWGTGGTLGVVLMSVGAAMGIPAPLIAGMVVSGACFGDKMSPVSDTTNLAAACTNVGLYDHIRSMLYTTLPTYLITLLLFTYFGYGYSANNFSNDKIIPLIQGLQDVYHLNSIALLPLLVLLVMGVKRYSAESSMVAAIVTAIFVALLFQDKGFATVLASIYDGEKVHTGVTQLDSLLSRGGIMSMMWTLSLSLMALALGGILSAFGFIEVLIKAIMAKIKSVGALVATTIIGAITGNFSMGETYISIILGGRLFSTLYDKLGVDRRVLSRSLEEGATLSTVLIPWTSGGAFFAATLGISVIDYVPWAFLNWINPLLAILFAFLGIAVFKPKKKTEKN